MPDYLANAVLFVVVAAAFVVAALLALRVARRASDPTPRPRPSAPARCCAGLVEAVRHLRERCEAGLGLLTIAAHRIVYGVVTVATILVYRNYFHTVTDVEPAIADLGVLVVATGGRVRGRRRRRPAAVGPLRHPRGWSSAACSARRCSSSCPARSTAGPRCWWPRSCSALTAQVIKICVDTLVQAHVDDDVKGRAFVLYDMVFNVALVVAATRRARPARGRPLDRGPRRPRGLLPRTGCRVRGRQPPLHLDRGTESLRAGVRVRGLTGLAPGRPRKLALTAADLPWSAAFHVNVKNRRGARPGRAGRSVLLLRPPGEELLAGAVGAEGALVDAALQQVGVRLADDAAGADAEDLHDLVAVEVGPHRVELLLLGEHGDPGLEVVVRGAQPGGAGPVPGGAVRAGQDVQALELVAGVADVAADGGVGPAAALLPAP